MTTDTPCAGPKRGRHTSGLLTLVFGAAGLLIAWSVVWGQRLQKRERRIKLGAAPFVGAWDFRVSPATIAAVLAAIVLVGGAQHANQRLGDRALLCWSGIGAAVFALALALADGRSAVLAPVVDPTEYWANLARLPSARELLRNFTSYDFLAARSVHVRGHPPGFILLLKGLAAIGLGAPWVAGALSFAGIALLIPAVGVATRAVCGPVAMRSMLPFLAVAPFSVWLGTSADAFFAAVAAWGIACMAVAVRRRRLLDQAALGFAAGVLLGAALLLTYGAATLAPLAVAVVIAAPRPRFRPILRAFSGAAVALGAIGGVFGALGFNWFAGLRLTNKFYWNGTAFFRTWTYFLLVNVAVLLVAVGPAVVAGIALLRNRAVWFVVGGSLACLAVATASQYSRGEVERIWLLFMPWLVPATAALGSGPTADGVRQRSALAWLSLQAALAIALQVTLRSKW